LIKSFIKNHKKIIEFIDKKTFVCLLLSGVLAICMLGVDLLAALTIQLFMATVFNINVNLPDFLNDLIGKDWTVFSLMILVGTSRVVLSSMKEILGEYTSEYFSLKQKARLMNYFLTQSERHYNIGNMLTMISDSVRAGASYISKVMRLIISSLMGIGIFISLVILLPIESLFCFALSSGVFVVYKIIDKKLYVYGKRFNIVITSTFEHLVTIIKNYFFIKISGESENTFKQVEEKFKKYFQINFKRIVLANFKFNIMPFLAPIVITAICIISIKYLNTESARLLSFFYLFNRLAEMFREFSSSSAHLEFNYPKIEMLYNNIGNFLFDHKKKIEQNKPMFPEVTAPPKIQFENVSYMYDNNEQNVIEQFSYVIRPGSFVSCIGPSGSGKSTLLGILAGILLPQSGSVKVNDNALDEFNLNNYLKTIGYVGPEPYIIKGCLRDNLLYGNSNKMDDDEIFEICKLAEIDFIGDDKEKNLDSELTEMGEGLSTGQKQRICLARALLRKPQILLLDEATANLDRNTEYAIIENLKTLKGDLTVFSATHREVVLKISDEVIDLEKI